MKCCKCIFRSIAESEEEKIHKSLMNILQGNEREDSSLSSATMSFDKIKTENTLQESQTSQKNDKIRSRIVYHALQNSEYQQYNPDKENNKIQQQFHSNDQSIVYNNEQEYAISEMDFQIQEGHSQKELRENFINRLEYRLIKTENQDFYTIFIYDWDDTFLCTSFLNRNFTEAQNFKAKLTEIASLVTDILERSLKMGRVYMVTNAMTDWVWQSCHKWIPNVAELLRRVEIISARELYEEQQPKPSMWKTNAFKLLAQKHLKAECLTNIVCMGDSNQEIESAVMMKNGLTNAFLKTIKLKENPHPIELYNQLEIVKSNLDMIVSKPKDLTIRLTKKD